MLHSVFKSIRQGKLSLTHFQGEIYQGQPTAEWLPQRLIRPSKVNFLFPTNHLACWLKTCPLVNYWACDEMEWNSVVMLGMHYSPPNSNVVLKKQASKETNIWKKLSSFTVDKHHTCSCIK